MAQVFTVPMENFLKTEIKTVKVRCSSARTPCSVAMVAMAFHVVEALAWYSLAIDETTHFFLSFFRFEKDDVKVHSKIRQRYDAASAKLAHTKRSETERLAELESELQSAKQQYQLSAIETVSKLKDSQVLASTEFLERTCAFLYAQKAYFHQGIGASVSPKRSSIRSFVHSFIRSFVHSFIRAPPSRVHSVYFQRGLDCAALNTHESSMHHTRHSVDVPCAPLDQRGCCCCCCCCCWL